MKPPCCNKIKSVENITLDENGKLKSVENITLDKNVKLVRNEKEVANIFNDFL